MLKSKLEKILRREDGTRVKIIVTADLQHFNKLCYASRVETCQKGKRTWVSVGPDTYAYALRKMDMKDRQKAQFEAMLTVVTKEELLAVQRELWQSLEPKEIVFQ